MAIQFLNTVAVDTDVLYVDTTNNRVGIGTTSPIGKLDITNGSTGQTYSNISGLLIDVNGTSNSYYGLIVGSSTGNSHLAVTNAGNVGIGTTGPTAPLHIQGGTTSEVLKIEADSNPYVRWVENGTNVGFLQFDGVNAYLSNMSNGSLLFRTNNTDKMTITGGGNVGIGTTSPSEKLDVRDGTITSRDSGNVNYAELDRFSGLTLKGNGAGAKYISTPNTDALAFSTNSSERMRITSTGNVGIGTTSPGAKLEVSNGSSGFTGTYNGRTAAVFEGGNSAGTTISIMSPSTGYSGLFFGDESNEAEGQIQYVHSTNAFRFLNVGGSERMRINSLGNVGIGTTSPYTNFEVVGKGSFGTSGSSNLGVEITSVSAVPAAQVKGYIASATSAAGGGNGDLLIASRTSAATNIRFFAGSTSERMRIGSAGQIGIGGANYGTSGQVLTSNGSGSAPSWQNAGAASSNWTLSGNDIYNNNSGNVGIGTTSPGAKLHIKDSSTSPGAIIESDGGNEQFVIKRYSNTNEQLILGFHSSDYGTIQAIEQGVAYRNLALNASGGNVGIGTTNPTADLSVGSTSTSSGDVHLRTTKTAFAITPSNTDAGGVLLDLGWVSGGQGPMKFGIGSAEKMRIDSSGNVGINCTPSGSKFQVNQSADQQGISLGMSSRGSSRILWEMSGTSNEGNAFVHYNGTNRYSMWYSARSQQSFYTENSERMRINSSGNVGIGTTSPGTYKLNVAGTGYYSNNLTVDGFANNAGISFRNGFDPTNTGIRAKAIGTGNRDGVELLGYNGIDFTVNNGANVVMRIVGVTGSGMGNVGIGTTSPTNVLHAHSDTDNDYVARFEGSTNNTSGVWTGIGIGGESNNTKSAIIFEDIGVNYSRGKLHLAVNNEQNQNSATKADARLTVNNNGNVGIGITSPTNYKLEVNGSVRGDSFGTDQNTTARIFAPSGAAYNGNSNQTGYLIMQLPDNAAFGINNMMSGVIRVFDYAQSESFDVRFSGYWYAGYNWTNCTAYVINEPGVERNFRVSFGRSTGASGSQDRPYIAIGDATSVWTYCKFSVIEYTSGHSNANLDRWNSGWAASLSSTLPGSVIATVSNTQTNNWKRASNNLYSGNSGNVGIGITNPAQKLHVSSSANANWTTTFQNTLNSNSHSVFTAYNNNSSNTRYGVYISGAGTTNSDYHLLINSQFAVVGDGNVGIGITSPVGKLNVALPADSDGNVAAWSSNQVVFTRGGTSTSQGLGFSVNDAANSATISSLTPAITWSDLAFRALNHSFYGNGSILSMYLNSSGNLGIGTTSPQARLHVHADGKAAIIRSNQTVGLEVQGGGNGADIAIFKNTSGTEKFSLDTNGQMFNLGMASSSSANASIMYQAGTGLIYRYSSSIRYKEDVKDLTNAVDKIMKLRPVEFKPKDSLRYTTGMIAEEVFEVMPEITFEAEVEGFDEPQVDGISYEPLHAYYIKAIQELSIKIEQLETRIQTLENN